MEREQKSLWPDIRPQEQTLVGLLLAHSICMGLVRVASETVANTLFIQRYGASALPTVFLLSALTNPLLCLAYSRLERRLSPGALFGVSLSLLLVGTLLARALLQISGTWPALVVMLFYQALYLLTGLEFWGLCAQLLDVRQSKRLLGLVSSGELAAQIGLGLAIPWLVRWCQTVDLLWVSVLGLVACLRLLSRLRREWTAQLEQVESEAVGPPQASANGYLKLLWAATAGYTLCACFQFQLFYDVASLRYPGESQLASFLGIYQAASGLLALLMGGLASGFVLERFGLAKTLLALPTAVMTLSLALAGTSHQTAPLWIFSLGLGLKLLDDTVFDTLYRPAFQSLRQPLSPEQRALALNLGEGLVEPVCAGLAGLLLLGTTRLGMGNQALTLSALALAWGGACWWLGRRYGPVLLESLHRRVLPENGELPRSRRTSIFYRSLPAATTHSVQALGEALNSPDPGVVIYLLKLLREVAPPAWMAWLRRNLRHPDPRIRQHVLSQLEENQAETMVSALTAMLAEEENPTVLASLIRTLATLAGGEMLERLSPYLDSSQLEIRQGVLVGLLKSGELEAIMLAGQRLTSLLQSPSAEERRQAAQVLTQVANSGLFRPVLKLLQDPAPEVRAQALEAAARLRHPRLWGAVLKSLESPGLRGLAVKALRSGGETVLPELDIYFVAPEQGAQMRRRLARIAGHLSHPLALEWLQLRLEDPDQGVRQQVQLALCRRRFQAQGQLARELNQRILKTVEQTLQIQEAWLDLRQLEEAQQLSRALEYQLQQHRQEILLCLNLLFDPDIMQRVRDNFPTPGGAAAALEVLEALLPGPLKESLFRVLEPALRGPQREPKALYEQIAHGQLVSASEWVRRCAERLLEGAGEQTQAVLTTMEKVIILKRVSLFAETPDEVLAEAAQVLEEVDVAAGQTLFEAGEVGNRLYIIVFGKVKVHLQGRLLNTLGPGEIFGEMSVLDSEPRTASVSTLEDSRLLQLSQDVMYELMADHTEVMRGIVRFLTSSLRSRLQSSESA